MKMESLPAANLLGMELLKVMNLLIKRGKYPPIDPLPVVGLVKTTNFLKERETCHAMSLLLTTGCLLLKDTNFLINRGKYPTIDPLLAFGLVKITNLLIERESCHAMNLLLDMDLLLLKDILLHLIILHLIMALPLTMEFLLPILTITRILSLSLANKLDMDILLIIVLLLSIPRREKGTEALNIIMSNQPAMTLGLGTTNIPKATVTTSIGEVTDMGINLQHINYL